MAYTFEEIKAAAEWVRNRYFPTCWESKRDIDKCKNIEDLHRFIIKYRQIICTPLCAACIIKNHADMLDAVGLRFQLYVDGRKRLYIA